MKVTIKTIPHKKQRYKTVGDWVVKGGELSEILVSYMGNDDYAFLVGIHEAIEGYLCLKAGVSQKEVDNFDIEYENARLKGITARCGCKPKPTSEPGFDRHAPYGKFHRYATDIERGLAKSLGISWKVYTKVVESL